MTLLRPTDPLSRFATCWRMEWLWVNETAFTAAWLKAREQMPDGWERWNPLEWAELRPQPGEVN